MKDDQNSQRPVVDGCNSIPRLVHRWLGLCISSRGVGASGWAVFRPQTFVPSGKRLDIMGLSSRTHFSLLPTATLLFA